MNRLSTAYPTPKMSIAQPKVVNSEGKKMPPECGNTQRGLTTANRVKADAVTNPNTTPRARQPYRKRAIPGRVKVEVALRYGAVPGGKTPAKCAYCDSVGLIWWPLTFTGKVGSYVNCYDLEFDHIHPEFRGGRNVARNLTLACRPCNRAKGSKTVLEFLGGVV